MYEIFENLLKERGVTAYKVAKESGVTQTALSNWKTGKSTPTTKTLQKIADYFGVTIDYLMTGKERQTTNAIPNYDNIFPIEVKKVPFLGEIACGEPIFANEDRESYVLAGTNINADFCLKARGDSMTGARINDGDIVFIREQAMVENGEIAAVIIDDEATLKRVYYEREKNKLYLQAENPKYPPLSYEGEELDHVRILGKAIIFQSDVI